MPSRLTTTLFGVSLTTPILAASGTFGYGVEFKALADLAALGGIVVKGLSREPMDGNPPPRLFETPGGMINSIGLQNIFGYAVEDYVEVVRVLEDAEGLTGYELNVSCPNTKHGGMYFSSDPALLAEVVTAVRSAARRPLIVKLSPNVARIEPLALAAEDAGANALSLINTFVGLAIDPATRKPRLGAGFGGVSGAGIKPIAVRMVYEAARAVKIPVIGIGGIATGVDAAEFLIAGASAVQVGTANFWDPQAPIRIARELNDFLDRQNEPNSASLVGTLQL